MTDRLKFIEINYHQHDEFSSPTEVLALHRKSNLFLPELAKHADVTLVKHLNFEGESRIDGIHYRFFKRKNGFFQVPTDAHRFVAAQNPDVVLVQGFIFPVQVHFLRRRIGRKARILLQHQGEVPMKRKKVFQKMMAKCVDGWLFSSLQNAREWIDEGIIRDESRCFVFPASSTLFRRKDKQACRKITGMNEGLQLLWVGRLNANKDPFTVLKAFEGYLAGGGKGRLHMIYSETDLEDGVRGYIVNSEWLRDNVSLVGKLPNEELENWYNAADYYILASHREGGSFALTEAMACGCVPIVSNIPASMQMIDQGRAGYFFEAGNHAELCTLLLGLDEDRGKELSQKAEEYFKKTMSVEAIAERMKQICEQFLATTPR